MEPVPLNFVTPGLFFLFVFLSGFWLNRGNRPYNMFLVTLHKLIGLAAGIYLGFAIYHIHQAKPLSPVQIAAVAITVLFFIVNVATGSLLSSNKPMPKAIVLINKWFPYLTLLSTIAMLVIIQ